jgi:hypothetical protein
MGTIDGTSWSDVTIDGDPVQEITVDGSVVWVASTPSTEFNGFEDMSPWNSIRGGQSTTYAHSGSNAYYSSQTSSTDEQATWNVYPNGAQPTSFSYWYRESGTNTGGGIRLKNSDGNYEGGTATNNPQFAVDFNFTSTTDVDSGGNYNTWVNVFWDFDWPNNQVTVSFDATDNSASYVDTYTLKQGVDISTIELWNYGSSWGNNSIDMYWDDVEIVIDGVGGALDQVGGFEDMSPWTTFYGGQATNKVYEGNYSYYCDVGGNTNEQAEWTPFPDGKQVDQFEYVYHETSSSTGGGIRLENSNGNYEAGTATDNPQYVVHGANTAGQVNDGALTENG